MEVWPVKTDWSGMGGAGRVGMGGELAKRCDNAGKSRIDLWGQTESGFS